MSVRDDNSSLGHFLYPPSDNTLTFNYRDTVNVSWTTSDATLLGFLSLWYWPGDGKWLLSMCSKSITHSLKDCSPDTERLKLVTQVLTQAFLSMVPRLLT